MDWLPASVSRALSSHLSRRGFLQLSAALGTGFACDSCVARVQAFPRADDLRWILVWLRGGLSPLDAFDPKPEASREIRGSAGTIPTAVPGIRFTEYFPRLARQADRWCIVRGLQPGNERHGVAEASLLAGISAEEVTSGTAETSFRRASLATQVAIRLGPSRTVWPQVQIGAEWDTRYGGGGTGPCSALFGPLHYPSAGSGLRRGVGNMPLLPGGVHPLRVQALCGPRPTLGEFARVWKELAGRLEQLQLPPLSIVVPAERDPAFDAAAQSAYREAISLPSVVSWSDNSPREQARYGESALGRDCLQARRAIEHGVRWVTVTSGGWDDHADLERNLPSRARALDAALAGLHDDLRLRGLLDRTRVICLSDFGRTPYLNAAGGRDHWPHTATCLVAGAGFPAGKVWGETDACGRFVVAGGWTPDQLPRMLIPELAPEANYLTADY